MSNWISVEERVPLDDSLVLVAYRGTINLGRWWHERWMYPELDVSYPAVGINIDLWAPIPELPRARWGRSMSSAVPKVAAPPGVQRGLGMTERELEALTHMHWCRSCAEGSWADCAFGGKAALALIEGHQQCGGSE